MRRVLNIEAICRGLWRVTVEDCGEYRVDVLRARSYGEAWEMAMRSAAVPA